MLRIHSIQPTRWDPKKVIQSNPVSYVDIWFIKMWYNPLGGGVGCKFILYTWIRNLAGGEFRISFPSISRIEVRGRYFYSQYLFIYFFIYISLFLMTNTIYEVREYFTVLIFNKYLVWNFDYNKEHFFWASSSVARKITTSNLIILAFLINFMIISLLFLSSPVLLLLLLPPFLLFLSLLLLLLLLILLFFNHYVIIIIACLCNKV